MNQVEDIVKLIQEYRGLQAERKATENKMKKVQSKIKSLTVESKALKVGRYSVFWARHNATIINVRDAKKILPKGMFEQITRIQTRNIFQVKYK